MGRSTKILLAESGYNILGSSSKDNKADFKLNFNSDSSTQKFVKDWRVPLYGIIFASGIEPQMDLEGFTNAHFNNMVNINLKGPLQILKGLKTYLIKGSSVIFLSSISANKGSYDPLYSMVKGGINSLVKTLALEFQPDIRVNAVAPSLIKDSPVYNRMTLDFRKKHLNASLNKRFLKSSESAKAISFLVENDHMNGQIIHLNGGQYFGN